MKRILSLLAILTCSFSVYSQNLSNKGKEFWVAYGHHQFFESGGGNTQEMVLYLSADQPANVTILINGTAYAQNYTIPANTVIATTPIPKSGTYDCRLFTGVPGFSGANSEGISDRGIHIISDVPIVAYSHIYGSASSGATMLMPIETWGYSYIGVNSQQSYSIANCYSWMYVVAREDNTKVQIIPSVPTRGGYAADVPFIVSLNKGQVYQVLGAGITTSVGYEMTGTKVRSIANAAGNCYPIGVFCGSSRTANPAACGSGGGDNDMQQLFPSQAWGKRYLTAPTSNSTTASTPHTNTFKILVKDPATVVRKNGVIMTGLIANTYYKFESNIANYIEADQPIMIAQFMTGGVCIQNGLGDPEMIYISPIEQGIKKIGFYRNTQQAITVNYLTLIIPNNGIPSLTIDGVGSSGFTYTYPHPNLAGYTVVIKRWNASQAQCIVQSDSAFTAITYGLGNVESYGYNAGTLVNNLNVIGAIHNSPDTATTTAHLFTCKRTPVQISMYVAYKPTNMQWLLSQVPVISPNTDYTIANPVPADSILQNGRWYYRYTLPGNYTFSDTGSIQIPVRNTHPSIDNCSNTEIVTFNIQVKPEPITDFTYTHTGCISDSVHFSSPNSTTNGYTANSWSWTFADATNMTGQNPVKLFTTSGAQNVNLKLVTAEGCLGDTTRSITIYAKPNATFGVSNASVCLGGTINLTDTSSYAGSPGINSWYWDFGNSSNASLSNSNPQSVTYSGYGTYTVKHVVKVSNTCVSDTFSKVINVYAKPNVSFSFPAGCLPNNGVVQFNNTTTTDDGQAINHSWTFGDASSTSSNPNTSTLQSPSHIYSYGTYTINYSATTANGCVKDSTFTSTFNIRAKLAYTPLNSVCQSVKGTVSLATASVVNNVGGHGVYHGPATDTLGNFTPSAATPGVQTIWYVFTSTGGCIDSVSTSIKVLPKPTGNFNVNTDICLNQTATITDNSTITSGTIIAWNWNFGDGNTASNTNGNPITKSYNTFNTYTIKLVAISDSSCVSDTLSKTIAVHALPLVNFTLPAAICMPNGSGTFTNATTIGDNASLGYVWNFGDASATSTNQNPTHTYTVFGPVTVRLTATSSFGCVKDSVKTLSAFYDKPVANFAVFPDTLCQGTSNVFTDHSTAPNSTIQTWNWSFGDGSTSNSGTPNKKYTQPGNYAVTLTVKNAAGCISDPFQKNVIVYLQPVIDAGPSFVVPEGTQIIFNPKANDSTVLQFLWTPSGDFVNAAILRPSIIATHNQVYTLTATGQGGCIASDTMSVKILKPVHIPNVFSPNGDGINDTWEIPNLADYPGCSVEIYNRYGQMIYQSYGYGTPWNGTYKGSPLPFATYYYIITLKNGFKPMTGSVTIIK